MAGLRFSAVLLVIPAALAMSSCGLSAAEEIFVNDVRRANPEVSYADASDEWLVAAGQRLCAGRDLARTEAALAGVGIDTKEFGAITVRRLCPAR